MNETINNETLVTNETKRGKNGLATAALVLGILSLITMVLLVNYIFGIVSLVLAIVYLTKKEDKPAKRKAIAGLVCAAVSIVASTCLWIGITVYLSNTGITTIMNDIYNITGGKVNPETIINDAIDSNISDKETIEQLLGKELNYHTICEFMGDEVSLTTIDRFVGDGIDGSEIASIINETDTNAVIKDLGGDITYKALETKLGSDFTYNDLKTYLKNFRQ